MARQLSSVRKRKKETIFGPVFRYDLVRTSRQGQIIGHRIVYVGFLAFALFMLYWNHFPNHLDFFEGPRLRPAARAAFAERFFYSFMIIQVVAIVLFTPLYTA